MALQVSIRESADVTILELRGRSTVNGGESESLSRQLKKLVTDSVCKLLLNVRDLTQVDSSGVSVIVGTYVSLKRRGGDLKLLHPSGRVLDVLTVFHLTGAIPIFEDEAEALDSFQSRAFSATP